MHLAALAAQPGFSTALTKSVSDSAPASGPKASLRLASTVPNIITPTKFQLPFPSSEPTRQSPTVLSHDENVPTLILGWQEDLGDHDEDLALGWGVDVPDALHACRVVARVVGRLDVASELT